MSTPAIIAITPGVGQLLDAVTLIVGANVVVRETMVIADPTNANQLAGVTAGGALMVDGSAAPQPVTNTGTFAVQATLTASSFVIGHVIVDSGAITASIAAAQTIAVTNIGTFIVQATLAAETTKVIGRVNQGTTPWIVGQSTASALKVTAYLNDGLGNAITSDSRGSARPLAVEILDASGNQITTFGSATTNITQMSAVVNAGNSSTTPLNAGLSFTGTPSVDLVTLGITAVQVQLLTDQPGILKLQFSTDNTNWDHTVSGLVIANESTSIATGIHGRYFRVMATNTSASNQTFLRLQTLLVPIPVSPTIKDLDTAIASDDNAMVAHAVITGASQISGGLFQNVKTSASGALQIAAEGSVLGDTVVTVRRNQIEINFSSSDATDATLITNTSSGSGAVTQANGEGIYSTGTAAAGQAKGVTAQSIIYRPANDLYAEFTVAFTTPTDATAAHDYQRIGYYNTNNGMFIGYEGTVFGLTVRLATVDTRTVQASFNLDTLNGVVSSKFTRAGIPEAVDWTKLNLFRIRFSWFGAAPVIFDIFTPDGVWLPFHIVRNPNTSNIPYIATPELPITIDAFKTASDGTNLQIRTGCWAAGVTESAIRLTDTMLDSTLAIPTRSVIVGHTTAGGGSYVNVKVAPSGALTVDASNSTGLAGTFVQGAAAAGTSAWPTRPGSPTTAAWSQLPISCSAAGANIIVAGVGGQTIRIMRMFFVNSDPTTTVNVTIQDTTPTSFSGAFRLITAGNFSAKGDGEPLYISASGKGIQLFTDAAVQLSGTVWYTIS